jgi:hypothetical protein
VISPGGWSMKEIIEICNPKIILFQIEYDKKIVDLVVTDCAPEDIEELPEIQKIFKEYRKIDYFLVISVSGTEDPRKTFDNLINDGFNRYTRNMT